jgi:lipopolysaccharide assembly outer membrane protein LptD (OstA)
MLFSARLLRAASLLVAIATSGAAALAAAPPVNGLETRDYKIQTDMTNSNLNTGAFTMPHSVRFYRPGTDATANRADGNYKNGTATLIGNVVVHDTGNAPEVGGGGAYGGSGTATLTCDRLEIDSKQKVYTATGHVHFAQGPRTATSDRGVLNRATGMLHLEGGVRLTDAGSTLNANVVDYNLNTKDAEVHGGPAVLTKPADTAPAAPAAAPKPAAKSPEPNPRRSP